MDPILLKHVIVPCALFASIVLGLKLVLDAVLRYRLLKEGVTPDRLDRLFANEGYRQRQETMRWGMLLVAGGLALFVIQWLGWTRMGIASAGLLALAIGLAQLAFYWLTRQKPPAV